MKSLTLSVILFRTAGVLLCLIGADYLVCYWDSKLNFIQNCQSVGNQSLGVQYFVLGVAIYFASPFLAKIVLWNLRDQ